MILRTASALLAILVGASVVIAQQDGLIIKRSIPLTRSFDGFEGTLQLLEDARLTPRLEKLLWMSGGPEMALDPDDPLSRSLTASPFRPAVLRLMDHESKVVDEVTLQRELARLQIMNLHEGHRTILVANDLSAGFGSYSGPLTQLLDLDQGKIAFVSARDTQHGNVEPIHLARTLKTDWRIVAPPRAMAGARDVLEIACRPNADAGKFFISYTRYHWTGTGWVSATIRSPGFWEADEPFPPAQRFPNP